MRVSTRLGDRLWHDAIPRPRSGAEHAVIADQMKARGRDQGCELLDQFERFEDDVGGSIAPAALEAIEKSPIGQAR